MRSIKGFVTSLGIMVAAALTGCTTEDGPMDEPGVGEDSSELSQAGQRGAHCVAESVAQVKGEARPTELSVAPARCFDTFSDAIFAATNGRVRLPPSVTAKTVTEEMLRGDDASAALASYVIGIEYQHPNFQGATLTITSPVTCYGYNILFPYSSFPPGWNDSISSARAFSSCYYSYHYENNFSGAFVNCGTACSYIGDVMNERTSSITWTF